MIDPTAVNDALSRLVADAGLTVDDETLNDVCHAVANRLNKAGAPTIVLAITDANGSITAQYEVPADATVTMDGTEVSVTDSIVVATPPVMVQ